MSSRPDGTDNITWTKGAAGLIVFACLLGGMWLVLIKAAQVLLTAIGLL